LGLTAVGILLVLAGFQTGFGQQPNLQGKVQFLDKEGGPLAQRMQAAARTFREDTPEGLYLTGYIFSARQTVRMGESPESDVPYRIGIKSGEIKIRRTRRGDRKSGHSMPTDEDQGGPAGIVLLHRVSGRKSAILDSRIIDPERTYTFDEIPIYWLGKAAVAESLRLLQDVFEDGSGDLQKQMVFAISMHDSSQVIPFLRRIALGDYGIEVRKNAIFWMGNRPGSLRHLKEIYARVAGTELKKQAVFAMSLSRDEEAVREMIRIARQEDNREVRKNAVFWIGQKASQEAAAALQDMVADSDEDEDVKKSAVFAISQLPKDRSIPMLISIAKSNPSSAVRRNAMFWLGQTGEEEALKFFEEILLKK
jgi:hypothetical protein